jgi:hypothetical protein
MTPERSRLNGRRSGGTHRSMIPKSIWAGGRSRQKSAKGTASGSESMPSPVPKSEGPRAPSSWLGRVTDTEASRQAGCKCGQMVCRSASMTDNGVHRSLRIMRTGLRRNNPESFFRGWNGEPKSSKLRIA